MNRNLTPSGRLRGDVELSIVALARSSLAAAELASMRQQSFEKLPTLLRPQFLKHSDGQTLAALEAVATAVAEFPPGSDFDDWAIVSASRYLGRETFAAAIDKYQVDGPWGVSVHVIPHTTAHAVAGTLSLALNCHGPCIGAAAAPGEEVPAVMSLAALLRRPAVAGAWFVTTGRDESGRYCQAAGLALVNANHAPINVEAIGRIRIDNSPVIGKDKNKSTGTETMTDFLMAEPHGAATWRGANGGLRIAVEFERHRVPNPSLVHT